MRFIWCAEVYIFRFTIKRLYFVYIWYKNLQESLRLSLRLSFKFWDAVFEILRRKQSLDWNNLQIGNPLWCLVIHHPHHHLVWLVVVEQLPKVTIAHGKDKCGSWKIGKQLPTFEGEWLEIDVEISRNALFGHPAFQ